MNYHQPGGAGLRGFGPTVAASQAYGLSLEFESTLWLSNSRLFRRGALALFGDLALANGDLDSSGENRFAEAGDAGVGIRIQHRIGQTSFQTRFDFPLWVSRPEMAQDDSPGDDAFGFRWAFSFQPAF
jgi:hypothetical protein